jgi:hypothetical protein
VEAVDDRFAKLSSLCSHGESADKVANERRLRSGVVSRDPEPRLQVDHQLGRSPTVGEVGDASSDHSKKHSHSSRVPRFGAFLAWPQVLIAFLLYLRRGSRWFTDEQRTYRWNDAGRADRFVHVSACNEFCERAGRSGHERILRQYTTNQYSRDADLHQLRAELGEFSLAQSVAENVICVDTARCEGLDGERAGLCWR